MASLNWNQPPPNPPSSSPSSLHANPPPYPPFRPVNYANPYPPVSFMGPHTHLSSETLSLQQMPSSIGPSRSNQRSTGIVTRRKAAQQLALQNGNVRDHTGNIHNGLQTVNHQQRPNSLGFMDTSNSRANGQNDYSLTNSYQPHHQAELPPLSLHHNGPQVVHPNCGSPQYPPTSAPASTYPQYFFHAHSRTNSNSTSNPRSASPALSIASALTSVSSSTANSFGHPQTPGNMSPIVRKHKKQRLFNVDRKEICLYHKENPNARQEDIAIKYGVERSTISKILKHKQKWMNVPEDEELKVAKHRPSKFPEIETELVEWLTTFTASNSATLSDSLIRTKAKEVAKSLKISEDKFKASSGWVENFKHRHGIRRGVWYGDGKAMKPPTSGGASNQSPTGVVEQRGGILPSFNSGFMSNVGSGDLIGDRTPVTSSNLLREATMEDDDYRTQQNVRPLTLRPSWTSSDRTSLETLSAGSSSSKATSDLSFSQSDGSASMHSPTTSLRPAWETQSAQTSPLDRSSTTYQPQEHQHQHQHPTSPDAAQNSTQNDMNSTSPTSIPSLHYGSVATTPPPASEEENVPYTGMAVYSNMPPIYRPTIDEVPNITEAEDAVDKVIRFIDAQPDDYITDGERSALTQIKYALFQTGAGIHHPRDKR